MHRHLSLTLLLTSLTSAVSTIRRSPSSDPQCPVIFDGRVPPFIQVEAFDRSETPFGGIRPRDIKWNAILDFPTSIPPSLFDKDYGGKAIQVGINDLSIIRPSGTGAQTGFRRSALIFAGNNGDDASTKGIKTYHWSVRQGRPLNFSHEYLNVFHERKDGKGYQFRAQIGTLIGKEKLGNSKNWKIFGHDDKVLFSTPMVQGDWENFAITLDYVQK
jgi:hypothetical protein